MSAYDGLSIAIIGMSGQFPMSADCNMYWQNLLTGKELIRRYSAEELLQQGVRSEELADLQFVRSASVLEEKEYFDHRFFDYRPEEAAMMDPQIRMFHTHCWKALEDAGYASGAEKHKTGLFATASDNDNWRMHRYIKGQDVPVDPYFLQFIANEKFVSSLVAYKLDLRGPVVYLDSACSSSLVAIHLACRSLLTRECNLAISGGVKIGTTIRKGYRYQEGTILSPDGHCRSFDIEAGGTIAGEGVGVVVLKRLADAIKSKDHVYAVIRASAVNNDGHDKVGYTAPSVKGQSDCIRAAHKLSGIDPRSISYIEAHGTATKLGDPIEIAALNHAFQTGGGEKFCAIGSVKSNMGHLDAAAGVAGLIKTVLSLEHRKIVPSLHYQEANPQIRFNDGPFYVNTELKDWPSNGDHPRRAGVSSFGIGGTNAHIVLEETPPAVRNEKEKRLPILTLSAKTVASLDRHIEALKQFILNDHLLDIDDIAYSYQVGRKHFEQRRAIVYRDRDDLIRQLSGGVDVSTASSDAVSGAAAVFVFRDVVSAYVNMGRQLYEEEPVFREEIGNGFRSLEVLYKRDLTGVLYPPTNPVEEIDIPAAYKAPIVLIFEYALAKLLIHYGVTPSFLLGEGVGVYTAACIDGHLTVGEALGLVAGGGSPSAGGGNDGPVAGDVVSALRRFELSSQIEDLISSGRALVLIETGPGRPGGFWEGPMSKKADVKPLVLIKDRSAIISDRLYFQEKVGKLWSYGIDNDWHRFYGDHFRRRIPLPTYSFEPTSFPAEVDPLAELPESVFGLRGGKGVTPGTEERVRPDGGIDNQLSRVVGTESRLIALMEDFLGISGLGADDNFFELGADSVQAMGFLISIKKAFGVQLSINVFFTDPTIRLLAERIDEQLLLAGKQERSVPEPEGGSGIADGHVVLQKQGELFPPIFIMPGIEGYLYLFKELVKGPAMRPSIYSVQAMGFNKGEHPLSSIEAIARQNIVWIKQVQSRGPYRLIGFSFGGLVAYEMVRQLEATGDEIEHAYILDVSADASPAVDHVQTLADVGRRLFSSLGIAENVYPDWIAALEEGIAGMSRADAIDFTVNFLKEKVEYYGEDVDFWTRVLGVLVNNLGAMRPANGKVATSLTIVKSRDGEGGAVDHFLGWGPHARDISVFSVPGAHASVLHNSLDKIVENFSRQLIRSATLPPSHTR